MSELRPELIICDDPMQPDPAKDGIFISNELTYDQLHAGAAVCDLLRDNGTGETFLIDPYKAGKFIADNPSFSIVGIGLSREATSTPYGQIGAVLE